MQTTFTIKVSIDTEKPGTTLCRLEDTDQTYVIGIRKDILSPTLNCSSPTAIMAVVCHEIGHAVANVFKLPAVEKTPHFFFPIHEPLEDHAHLGTTYVDEDVVAMEEEAWKVAESIFNSTKKLALGTYHSVLAIRKAAEAASVSTKTKWHDTYNRFPTSASFTVYNSEDTCTRYRQSLFGTRTLARWLTGLFE